MTAPGPLGRRVVVPERGTGLRRSRVCVGEGPRCLWQRKAGPEAPTPLVVPTGSLRTALASGRTPRLSAIMPPEVEDGWAGYPMRAQRSLSEELVTGLRRPDDTVLAGLAELGRLLRLLHDLSPGLADAGAPAAVDRLRDWYGVPDFPGRPGEVTGTVRTLVGPTRWRLLADWADDTAARPEAVVHGWCGLGHVALDDEGCIDLCVGDDLGLAPAELDLGGVLGQLHELRTFLPRQPAALWWQEAAAALLDGYGPCDARLVARSAALGLALHVHDFAHYFDVRDAELPHWGRLLCHAVDRAAG